MCRPLHGPCPAGGNSATTTNAAIWRQPRVQQSRPGVQMQAGTGPRRVEARPVQAIAGAGQAAAESVVASCKTLDELEAALNAFDGGLLKRSAKNTVFADGTRGAPLMIVGEAPGADEDQQGKPFVGVSGQLLDKMLNASGMSRDKDVYISNVVPWRPLGNRTPDQAVITMCLPFIRKHIELAAPKAVLMLGGVSAKALLAPKTASPACVAAGARLTSAVRNSPHYRPITLLISYANRPSRDWRGVTCLQLRGNCSRHEFTCRRPWFDVCCHRLHRASNGCACRSSECPQ